MGLPLAAQFAGHGWNVVAVDIDPRVVDSINDGRSHVGEEPGLAELVERAHAAGRLRATADGAEAARAADVVVLIVPVMLDATQHPDHGWMDAAVESIAPGIHAGSLVIFETTLPVGDTRDRYAPRLEAASGLPTTGAGTDRIHVAFSPERLYSGSAISNLATYPKLVGGLDARSTALAAAFYESVLDAEVVAMSSAEAAEFSKLADTTYRDVNIALANEFARYADRIGVDITEVIAAANSQPYSHIHQPGIGAGGHCIPVYPHFLLDRAPELSIVARARAVNDGQVDLAVAAVEDAVGELSGVSVLVLGLTYRHGVKELAYSRATPLIEGLRARGARVLASDPLLTDDEITRAGAVPWVWGSRSPDVRAIVTQTADPAWLDLDPAWFPGLRAVYDGRNSLSPLVERLGAGVAYRGVGVPDDRRAPVVVD
jgi:nucleotide sugar dehydrogenase